VLAVKAVLLVSEVNKALNNLSMVGDLFPYQIKL
jgi:hypothetical protein